MTTLANPSARCAGWLLLIALAVGGCGTWPARLDQAMSDADADADALLSRVCPLPSPDPDSADLASQDIGAQAQVVRARLLLAAVAGYAVASIERYSGSADSADDARVVLDRLQDATASLALLSENMRAGNHLVPLYRTDFYLAAGRLAEVAMRPTLRAMEAGGAIRPASLHNAKLRARLLQGVLEDELYLRAITQSCQALDTSVRAAGAPLREARLRDAAAFTRERYRNRCTLLARLAKQPAGEDAATCGTPWQPQAPDAVAAPVVTSYELLWDEIRKGEKNPLTI
jgi:hypothetical protein